MKAKEMFEELGYIVYVSKNERWLCVKLKKFEGNVNISDKVSFYLSEKNIQIAGWIDLKLNKAIQKQIEELGWE